MATAKKAAPKTVATKAAAPKTTVKKAATPQPEAAKKRQPSAAFMKALVPSATLAAVIGTAPLPRTEVTRKIWEYIKAQNLQDPTKRTMINADAKLKVLFGKDQVSMFEMTKIISGHLS